MLCCMIHYVTIIIKSNYEKKPVDKKIFTNTVKN